MQASVQTCPKCGALAQWSALGEMYYITCGACGHEEEGVFYPAELVNMPRAKPLVVTVGFDGVPPTGRNLFLLSRLHPKLSMLSPVELKALVVGRTPYQIKGLSKQAALNVQRAADGTGFSVHCAEDA